MTTYRWLNPFWIAVAAAAIFFTNLGATRLWDEDETLYASISREMLARSDWVVPMFNGRLFPEKPPIMFWSIGAGFEVLGVNEFGARCASALFGIAGALATYSLGRRLFGERAGFWAGMAAASTIIYTVSARAATADSALALATTLAMLGFAAGLGLGRNEDANRLPDTSRWASFAFGYACLGVAVLTKGPIGFLLPAASLGLFLWIMLGPKGFFRAVWRMRPFTAALIVLAVAVPWYAMVGLRTDGEWLRGFFAKFNLRPFKEPFLGHGGPFWYYLPAILIGFFPWSSLLGQGIMQTVRSIRNRDGRRPGLLFAACWIGVFTVFWSICRTKLPHYVLPAYPALALMIGCFVDRWLAEPGKAPGGSQKSAGVTLVVVGTALIAAMPFVCRFFLPGESWIGLTGLPLVVGGAWFLLEVGRGKPDRAMTAFGVTAVAFLVGMFGFAAVRVAGHQDVPPLLAAIRADAGEGGDSGPIAKEYQLGAFRYFRQSMVFYSNQHVTHVDDIDRLARFLRESPRPYVFTLDVHEKELNERFPGELRVVDRHRRFLHYNKGVVNELIVLAKRSP